MKFQKEHLKKDYKIIILVVLAMALYLGLGTLLFESPCPLRKISGIPCPGCGLTRACFLAVQFKFGEATQMHLFWIAVAIVLIAWVIIRYFIADENTYAKAMKILIKVIFVICILMMIYYLYRMITVFPMREPMLFDKHSLLHMLGVY